MSVDSLISNFSHLKVTIPSEADYEKTTRLFNTNLISPVEIFRGKELEGFVAPEEDVDMVVYTPDGMLLCYKDRKYHRLNQPAVVYPDGTSFYYQNGELHNENDAAIQNADGSRFWYIHGKLIKAEGAKIKVEKIDMEI
jgi:hypothetical protein